MFKQYKNQLHHQFDTLKVIIQPWGQSSLRVRVWKQEKMPSEDWALIEPDECEPEINISKSYASITNGKIKAVIDYYGKLKFYNQNKGLLLEEFYRNSRGYEGGKPPADYIRENRSSLGIEAKEFQPILGGDYKLKMRFESNPKEKLYGMGQYQQENLNLKGCDIELAQRNSQASVPFVLSNLGYGFLWNNPAVGRVTFSNNVTTWEAHTTKCLDYFITAGDTPQEIQEAYGRATGCPPMMPDYAMGFWQCKLRYQSQDELLGVAREYKRRGLPLSVIVIDFFHWTLQGEWKFDEKYWPDPKAMIDELKEMGIELMVSIWPTVDHKSEYYGELEEKGLLIQTDRGQRIGMEILGNTIPIDLTNPEAREFIWNKAKESYYDKGAHLFWLDVAEPEYSPYDFDLYRLHLGPSIQVGNIYPLMYAKTFFDGMVSEGQDNIVNLIRCAWAGSQRYGALVWSGDIDSSFQSLRAQFAAGLNMGIAGIPWWTTDIGGFHGGNIHDPAFIELLIRWFEYGTFCPVMRLHGNREPNQPPLDKIGTSGGGVCSSGAANEVYSYGEDAYEIFRKYMFIRENMKPYIIKLMEDVQEKNTPVIRPLFFDFPQDSQAWEIEDEYMFGPDILVAPVMEANVTSRNVYLPKGSSFKNIWTNEVFLGGRNIEVSAPIEIIPVFHRIDPDASGKCPITL